MTDRLFERILFIAVIFVFHHAECGSTKQSAVTPSILTSTWTEPEAVSSVLTGLSTDASTTTSAQTSTSTVQIGSAKATGTAKGNGCSMGLVYGLIAACIVLLIGVILAIIVIIRMKRTIKYLQTINYSTHGGEVVQEFEMKMEDDVYDNLHDKKENANEYRDLHKKYPRTKDINHKQPPKLPERRNPTDIIIIPNSLVESLEAEFKDIRQRYVQGSDDDDTGDYPNLDALSETKELKMTTNDLKGSSAKTVQFDNSVTVISNELEEDEEVCEEKETETTEKVKIEFTEHVDKIVTVDMDLPSYDDADLGGPGLNEECDNENKLQKVKKGIRKVSKEDEYNDQEDDLYEPYDDSNEKNNGRDKYRRKIPEMSFNSKENGIPAYDDEIIEEFVYEESQTSEIDHKNTNQRDMRSNNAKPLQQQMTHYDEALYEEPVSSNFRDSGLPNSPVSNISKLPTLTMPLQKKFGNNFQSDRGVLQTSKERLSDESIITKSVHENGEGNEKFERSKSEITALGVSPVPPAVPKRKEKVAPKLSVSSSEDKVDINIKGLMERNKTNIDVSENISGNVLGYIGEDNLGFDLYEVPSMLPRRADGLSSPFDQNQITDPLTKSSSYSSEA